MAAEFKIKVNDPTMPKDDLIEVAPFGHVENGSSFTAILTQDEADRYDRSPVLEVEKTKRKKSDLNDDDRAAWDSVEAQEAEEKAVEEALEAAKESTPVAGEESIAATEPDDQGGK